MKPGRPARVDYEYERNGTANLFMLFAPLEGWRHVKVTDRHTAVDYAHVLRDLADIHFAARQHNRAGPGQSQHPQQGVTLRGFPGRRSQTAGRTLRMALHAQARSWLNLAESELGVLSSQCLDRRIPDKETLIDEIAAWEHDRNAHNTPSQTGTSPPKTHALNSSISTLQSD